MGWSVILNIVLGAVAGILAVLWRRQHTRISHLETDRTEDRSRIHSLQSRLAQAQRLEAVGIFAGSIIHNLNNLLSVILGHTRLASDAPELADETRTELRKAMDAGRVAGDLLADLSRFYRRADLGRKPTDLLPIVRDTVKLLSDILPSAITIEADLQPCGPVLASSTGVQQVLMNLCSNAAQAMQHGQGRIQVTLREEVVPQPLQAVPRQLEAGSYVRLGVKDNGRGMDQASLERILESYYGDHPVDEDLGLGLATVCRLMDHMQGVAIPSTKTGRGTTFGIYFPLIAWSVPDVDDPLALPEDEKEAIPPSLKVAPVRILLVDDEEMVAEVLSRGLRRLGHEVTTVTDSRKALEIFARRPREFDVVITDQIMPHMSGVRLVRELQKVRSGVPVILTTGFQDSYHERQAREVGVRDFVLKPCSHLDLAQAVSRLELGRLEGRA